MDSKRIVSLYFIEIGFFKVITLSFVHPCDRKVTLLKCHINLQSYLQSDVYTVRPNTRSYSTSPTPYTEVAPVFERIKGVASKAFIKKINAVYVFEIEEEGKWHLDLKNGEGSIGQGDPSSKPDVNIILKKETFLKIFNRELKPATAFMNGEVKLSGDLSKIMSLEAMMKSTRNN